MHILNLMEVIGGVAMCVQTKQSVLRFVALFTKLFFFLITFQPAPLLLICFY